MNCQAAQAAESLRVFGMLLGLSVAAGLGGGCEEGRVERAPLPPKPVAVVTTDASSSVEPIDAGAPHVDAAPATVSACPDDMLLVDGELCPVSIQICVEHHPEYLKNKQKSERCLRYRKPSHCLSEQGHPMRFCIDQYEWPNQKDERPLVLVQWLEATELCASVGKRLCDEAEWLFACEGEEMLPHVYGYERDATKCLIDKPYVLRGGRLKRYTPCQEDPKCKREFERLDQRAPAGSYPECVSPFGAYDMNGSVNEWVNVPGRPPLHRSGLKGGWWGPVRNRCRPTVLFHKEDDWGYEAGFRCCKDALRPDGTIDDRRTDAGPPVIHPEQARREDEGRDEPEPVQPEADAVPESPPIESAPTDAG